MLVNHVLVLEEIYKSKKNENSDQFNLRIQRGLSWFKKALQLDDDLDLKFISLWIGFSAVYAKDMDTIQEQQLLRHFFQQICQLDQERKINHLIWDKLNQPIRSLIESPYTFQAFWDCQNKKISQIVFTEILNDEKNNITQIFKTKDSVELLWVVFNRFSTIKRQLIQGGSTYHSSLNRKRLEDACNVLSSLLSAFMHTFLEHAKIFDSDKPYYPVVQVS